MSKRSSRQAELWRRVGLWLAAVASAGGAGCGRQGSGGSGDGGGEPLRVAAAADLGLAFEDIGRDFEAATGKAVSFSFGSTGLLAKQIEEGAPFDVFAAADVSFVDDVIRAGACAGETKRLYAIGRVVLWAGTATELPADLDGLSDPRFAKIAIANPEHAPYGRAAQQALRRRGLWDALEPRAVYGENVRQTLMFAQSGNAEVALVALSLAIASGGHYVPIDSALHDPLEQAMVVCRGGAKGARTRDARAFLEHVSSARGRAIMKRYGFLLPGEAAASL